MGLPLAFIVRFDGNTYLFRRGFFDDEQDDYPSEYEVILRNDINFETLSTNFNIEVGGDVVGTIDMRKVVFDPSHREKINADVFALLEFVNR